MKLKYASLGLLAALGMSAAHSAVIVNATEVGTDVVFSGGGSLNTTGSTVISSGDGGLGQMRPDQAAILLGDNPHGGSTVSTLTMPGFSGPTNFGSGGYILGSSGDSTTPFGIIGVAVGRLRVPDGYNSGDPLSSSITFANETFASLGMTIGTYVWEWGSGANADSFTLNITNTPPPTSVPNPMPLALMGLGLLGLMATRRKA